MSIVVQKLSSLKNLGGQDAPLEILTEYNLASDNTLIEVDRGDFKRLWLHKQDRQLKKDAIPINKSLEAFSPNFIESWRNNFEYLARDFALRKEFGIPMEHDNTAVFNLTLSSINYNSDCLSFNNGQHRIRMILECLNDDDKLSLVLSNKHEVAPLLAALEEAHFYDFHPSLTTPRPNFLHEPIVTFDNENIHFNRMMSLALRYYGDTQQISSEDYQEIREEWHALQRETTGDSSDWLDFGEPRTPTLEETQAMMTRLQENIKAKL